MATKNPAAPPRELTDDNLDAMSQEGVGPQGGAALVRREPPAPGRAEVAVAASVGSMMAANASRANLGPLALALARAQAAFPNIPKSKTVTVKTRTGDTYTFSYAPLDAILDATRKPLCDNGLAVTQLLDGELLVTMLLHEAGGALTSTRKLPSTSGPQELGSVITYIRRYALQAILGVAAEEDDDANRAAGNSYTKKAEASGGGRHAPAPPPAVAPSGDGVAAAGTGRPAELPREREPGEDDEEGDPLIREESINDKNGKPVRVLLHRDYDDKAHISRPQIRRLMVAAFVAARQHGHKDDHENSAAAILALTRIAGQHGLTHFSLCPYRGETYNEMYAAIGTAFGGA